MKVVSTSEISLSPDRHKAGQLGSHTSNSIGRDTNRNAYLSISRSTFIFSNRKATNREMSGPLRPNRDSKTNVYEDLLLVS